MPELHKNSALYQQIRRRWTWSRLLRIWSNVIAIWALAAAGFSTASAQTAPGLPSPAPVPYASVNELNGIVEPLKTTAASMQTDLENLRIEKWKTDAGNKRQTQANVDSIRRNLQSALPDILAQVSASPEELAASFKLYRNLDALYDVFGSVVENTGAFGSKNEFQSLSNDMNGLESARRAMGERLQKLASAKEDEIARLRAQVKTLSAAIPPPPPKKIIVDDNEPPTKPPAKKKKTTKPANSSAPAKKPTTANPPPSE